MSALALCRECYSWAEPREDACPVCRGTLDLNQPDPTPEDLRDVIGRVERCLGEVTTPRKLLPDRGLLYLTSGGLFFLPHDVTRVPVLPAGWSASDSLMWALAALVWSPLAIAGALLRFKAAGLREIVIPIPRRLPSGDYELPASFLMDDPGSFFIPRRSVRLVRRTWRGWLVECRDRAPIRFRAKEPTAFAAGITNATYESSWAGIVMA
jgi:hypothetical protein